MINNYVLYKNIKELDLHGENRYSAKILINEFINDNYKLKERYVKIVHGKGSGVLRKITAEVLKKNNYVADYKIDIFNEGVTIVLIKELKKL